MSTTIMEFSKENKTGFTLIELLVAITIMAILVGITLVALQGTKASARDAQRKANLEDIRSALEIYRADCGSYPTSLSFGSAGSPWRATCNGTDNTYMSQVPQDPLNAASNYTYEYYYNSTTKAYALCSYLEQSGTSSSCASQATMKCQTGAGAVSSCRYNVASP